MSNLDPELIFDVIASQLPKELHEHVLIIGSLAAAYHYKARLRIDAINTKDADVVVQPAGADEECKTIANRLLAEGWRRRERCVPKASQAELVEDDVIRLHPPKSDIYFVELLALPRPDQTEPKKLIPVELVDGWHVLPAFRHLRLVALEQRTSKQGLQYAAPEMMALSNLLAHRTLGTHKTTEEIGGRRLIRSAKDLGRVLALAELAGRAETEQWPEAWEKALRRLYTPAEVADLGAHAGDGFAELFTDLDALADALLAVDIGLLNGFGMTREALRATADRLVVDALDPLAERTRA